MNTTHTPQENISALIDNELSGIDEFNRRTADDIQLKAVLDQLTDKSSQARKVWDEYHLIADALHSDDLAFNLSPGFSDKFSKLLDAEPTIMAPKPKMNPDPSESMPSYIERAKAKFSIAQFMSFGAVAAASALTFLFAPQLLPGLKSNSADQQMAQNYKPSGVELASVSNRPDLSKQSNQGIAAYVSHSQKKEEANPDSRNEAQVEMLRDPRLDSYLMAHQKSSPSLASTLPFVTNGNSAPASAVNGK